MSDLSLLSDEERKSHFRAVTSVDDPLRTLARDPEAGIQVGARFAIATIKSVPLGKVVGCRGMSRCVNFFACLDWLWRG
jgi:hypothetical protein